MSRIVATIAFLLVCGLLHAQSTQSGFVKEYNVRLAKSPLAGVELIIHNAGSTTSGKDGGFKLEFRTQKSGDKIKYIRIEKLGYEIFNKEALGQWYISSNDTPFTIVMCKSTTFKAIRDNYNKIASESYSKQQKKEEDLLAAEYKAGRLQEENYKKQLAELRNYYASQLENLDNYVDNFSRIDLSELSEKEQCIIDLVQQGFIDEAIAAYERQAFLKTYMKESKDIAALKDAKTKLEIEKEQHQKQRDSIYASVMRQINTYTLAGGRENFSKAEKLLKNVALADTTNLIAVKNYSSFAYGQHHFKEAQRFCQIYLDNCTNKDELLSTINNLGAIFAAQLNYTDAEKCYLQSLNSYLEWSKTDTLLHAMDIARAQCNLGNLYLNTKQYDKAERYYIEAIESHKMLENPDDEEAMEGLATIQSNLGVLYMSEGRNEESANFLKQSLKNREQLYAKDSLIYRDGLASVLHNLAGVEENLQDTLAAIKYYQLALHHRLTMYKQNPNGYLQQLSMTQNNLGHLYGVLGEQDQARTYLEEAYNSYQLLYAQDSVIYCSDIAHVELMLGMIYFREHKLEQSRELLTNALNKRRTLINNNDPETIEDVNELASALAIVYEDGKQDSLAEKYYLEALDMAEKLIAIDSVKYLKTYSATLYSFALNQHGLRKNNAAIGYMVRALDGYSKLVEAIESEEALYYLSEGMSKAGIWCYEMEQFDKAEALYQNAITCYQMLYQDDKDMMRKVCAGVEINLGILHYDQKQYEKCVYYFEKANLALNGKYNDYLLSALNSLAYQLAENSKYDDAIAAIDKAIAIMPTEANYYDTKGEILLMKGDTQKALLMWKKVLECNPNFVADTKGRSELYGKLKELKLIE